MVHVIESPARVVEPCVCDAYPFPHRPGGGECADPGPRPDDCADCEHNVAVFDPFGTGDHWYWENECGHPVGCPWLGEGK